MGMSSARSRSGQPDRGGDQGEEDAVAAPPVLCLWVAPARCQDPGESFVNSERVLVANCRICHKAEEQLLRGLVKLFKHDLSSCQFISVWQGPVSGRGHLLALNLARRQSPRASIMPSSCLLISQTLWVEGPGLKGPTQPLLHLRTLP